MTKHVSCYEPAKPNGRRRPCCHRLSLVAAVSYDALRSATWQPRGTVVAVDQSDHPNMSTNTFSPQSNMMALAAAAMEQHNKGALERLMAEQTAKAQAAALTVSYQQVCLRRSAQSLFCTLDDCSSLACFHDMSLARLPSACSPTARCSKAGTEATTFSFCFAAAGAGVRDRAGAQRAVHAAKRCRAGLARGRLVAGGPHLLLRIHYG